MTTPHSEDTPAQPSSSTPEDTNTQDAQRFSLMDILSQAAFTQGASSHLCTSIANCAPSSPKFPHPFTPSPHTGNKSGEQVGCDDDVHSVSCSSEDSPASGIEQAVTDPVAKEADEVSRIPEKTDETSSELPGILRGLYPSLRAPFPLAAVKLLIWNTPSIVESRLHGVLDELQVR